MLMHIVMSRKEEITLAINGRPYRVNDTLVTPETTLNTFIRNHALLKGTKYMCKEGHCGACMVTMQFTHPITRKDQFCAINSCLMPVLACHGASITTVEGIGNKQLGYHEIQTSLASGNGTQCGYCSPGMVMTIYSALKCNPNMTQEEMERSFCGNTCRCTGYRPIIQSARSALAVMQNRRKEGPQTRHCEAGSKCFGCEITSCRRSFDKGVDQVCIEELDVLNFAELALAPKSVQLEFGAVGARWFKVANIFEIMQVFDLIGKDPYILVAGNTSRGIYPQTVLPTAYIDIRGVKELQQLRKFKSKLVLGANMSLADVILALRKTSNDDPLLFGYMDVLADHMSQIANQAVRNVATLAGNLEMKRVHREFVSDVFLILEVAGATLKINELNGTAKSVSMMEYLRVDMKKKVITAIELPAISSKHFVLKTYKVMPRKQNALSLLSAGFLFRIMNEEHVVEERPKIILAGIGKNFVHATSAEAFLKGKKLLDAEVITETMSILSKEIQPSDDILASPAFRRKLACSLFYKFILKIGSEKVEECFKSGGEMLVRPISTSVQEFITRGDFAPVGQPIQKLEAMQQCSGEAEYVDDIPKFSNELSAALVLAEEAAASIHSVDPTRALEEKGIVGFFGVNDIPGVNSFGNIPPFLPEDEEIFCSGKVLYSGQPVGVLVGEHEEAVRKAVGKVVVKYSSKGNPMFTLGDVIRNGDTSRILLQSNIQASSTKGNIKYEIEGEYCLGPQCHYALELLCVLVVPTDHGLKVFPTSQWIQSVQTAIAQSLGIPENTIDIEVKRIGGGFGGKMTRVGQVAAACAIAAYKLNAPVRLSLDLRSTMKFLGKRCPLLTKYKVSVDEDGGIQKLSADLYEDYGISMNDPLDEEALHCFQNCYDYSSWSVNVYAVKTDNIRTYARGPGSVEGMASIEHIMDHIAEVTGKDPSSVRLTNTNKDDLPQIQEIIDTVKATSDFAARFQAAEDMNKKLFTLGEKHFPIGHTHCSNRTMRTWDSKGIENCERHFGSHLIIGTVRLAARGAAVFTIHRKPTNRWRKRGIALVPMKFMISFAPSYYGTVAVFPGDGSVAVTTGGIEMGQGVNTKAAQVCAYALGISLDKIRVVSSKSITSPGNFPSGSSLTSDSVCSAVMSCCDQLKKKFEPLKEKIGSSDWLEVVKAANMEGVSLIASHCYSPSETNPNNYPVYGAAVLEVELDVLTGQYQIIRADILEDAGESLNPAVDIGQIEGGFIMGLGYFSSENVICDPKTGTTLTCSSTNYWPPGAMDIPADFRVTLRKNAPNPLGVLRSKATGEPPLCMSCVLLPALRHAISSARKDTGNESRFEYGQPCTFEKTLLACDADTTEFKI